MRFLILFFVLGIFSASKMQAKDSSDPKLIEKDWDTVQAEVHERVQGAESLRDLTNRLNEYGFHTKLRKWDEILLQLTIVGVALQKKQRGFSKVHWHEKRIFETMVKKKEKGWEVGRRTA